MGQPCPLTHEWGAELTCDPGGSAPYFLWTGNILRQQSPISRSSSKKHWITRHKIRDTHQLHLLAEAGMGHFNLSEPKKEGQFL